MFRACIVALLMIGSGALAQPPRQATPDYRVVFRIYAPKASAVTLTGDFVTQGRGTAGPLEKEELGVWSITVGPLVPDFYSYSFTVDGVRTIDPKNAMVKQGPASKACSCFPARRRPTKIRCRCRMARCAPSGTMPPRSDSLGGCTCTHLPAMKVATRSIRCCT